MNISLHSNFLFLALIVFALNTTSLKGQEEMNFKDFGGIIYMDSLTVTASRSGFKPADFIEMVKRDSSFYTAFLNIREMEYYSENDIRFFNKKGRQIAGLKNSIRQNVEDNCRTMDILEEQVTGNYYKRNKAKRYYSAKMYEEIFFTPKKVCTQKGTAQKPSSGIKKRIEDLKVLIFKPGSTVDVPIVGKKTQIYDEALLPYYNYTIESKKYKSGTDCYVFSTKLKDNLPRRRKQKTIIKNLETYFDKSTFAVIARNYTLYYNSGFVDFDVQINIELTKSGTKYVPEYLHLEGEWDIPFKPKERVWFETKFVY